MHSKMVFGSCEGISYSSPSVKEFDVSVKSSLAIPYPESLANLVVQIPQM